MRRGWILLGLGGATYLLSLALARSGTLVEAVYGRNVGPWIARTLSLLTGWLPVSVMGLVILALGATLLLRLARRLAQGRAADRSLGRSALEGASLLAGIAGILTIAFYVTWGFNYARPPLEQRAGFAAADTIGVAELQALAREAAAQANQAYRALHGGSRDIGDATDVPFPLGFGMFGFFAQFFNPLVLEGFPYYLGWCWGGINLIVSLVLGLVLGAIVKRET